ncbi:hypothetical protein H0H92_014728 [Tricholoma furcatifolium]|nr:hypothetical protein H0H92_014728 [Tricholoma furcatifolium]
MNTEGRPVISVSDSSTYIKEVAALHGIKSNRRKKNRRGEDSDKDDDMDEDEAPLIGGQIWVKKSKDIKKSKSKSHKGKSKATMRSDKSEESQPASRSPLHDDAPREKGTKKKTMQSKVHINISSESDDEEVTPTPWPKKCRAPDGQSQPLERNKKSHPHPATIEAYLDTWALARGFQPLQSGEQHTLRSDGITHVALNDPFDED